jgi:hypothetical protein
MTYLTLEKRQNLDPLYLFNDGKISLLAAPWDRQPYSQWFVDYHDEMHPAFDEVIDCSSALKIQGWELVESWNGSTPAPREPLLFEIWRRDEIYYLEVWGANHLLSLTFQPLEMSEVLRRFWQMSVAEIFEIRKIDHNL